MQGTFAVNGIDTPEPVSDIRRGRPSGRPYLIWKAIDFPCLAASRRPGQPNASPVAMSVKDATGQSLAYVYARETERDAHIAKVLTEDEARRIASNIAKLPTLSESLIVGTIGNQFEPL